MHKSQGFGSPERRGTSVNFFQLLVGEPATADLFEGVDLSWNRIRGGAAVGKLLDAVHRAHDPSDPAASVRGSCGHAPSGATSLRRRPAMRAIYKAQARRRDPRLQRALAEAVAVAYTLSRRFDRWM
jgi:hypothetical protein